MADFDFIMTKTSFFDLLDNMCENRYFFVAENELSKTGSFTYLYTSEKIFTWDYSMLAIHEDYFHEEIGALDVSDSGLIGYLPSTEGGYYLILDRWYNDPKNKYFGLSISYKKHYNIGEEYLTPSDELKMHYKNLRKFVKKRCNILIADYGNYKKSYYLDKKLSSELQKIGDMISESEKPPALLLK